MIKRTATRDGIRDREQVQALVRGLQVLGYMNRVGISSNTLVAKRFGLKVSTAHRLLMVLTRMGMLRHDLRGHQFMLASNVRALSAGYRESRFVKEVAVPRMEAWTRRHGMRLLLVADDNDNDFTVLASTSANWPLSRELPVAGSILSETDSSEETILRQARTPVRNHGKSAGAISDLRRRVVVRTLGAEREIQISVLLLTKHGFRGSLSIRCSTDIVRSPKAARQWAAELRTLATSIGAANEWPTDVGDTTTTQ